MELCSVLLLLPECDVRRVCRRATVGPQSSDYSAHSKNATAGTQLQARNECVQCQIHNWLLGTVALQLQAAESMSEAAIAQIGHQSESPKSYEQRHRRRYLPVSAAAMFLEHLS